MCLCVCGGCGGGGGVGEGNEVFAETSMVENFATRRINIIANIARIRHFVLVVCLLIYAYFI